MSWNVRTVIENLRLTDTGVPQPPSQVVEQVAVIVDVGVILHCGFGPGIVSTTIRMHIGLGPHVVLSGGQPEGWSVTVRV